ncbi:hypothetical protein ACFPT7_04145 [Acidicapsa dinghuensis]|uniref:Metallo-beta-lactamase domain-containing protein n=1 Tax=Acidicapsa dinghuensis TaxID=2218256 RepID=A0ABW1EAW8_9BACT|nr:hypothetical protein [Acidicapsa dinghuensis]
MRIAYSFIARAFATLLILASTTSILHAQYGNKGDDAPGYKTRPRTLTTTFVKTGLYVISGGGGNSVLRLSGGGLIVVDGKLPGNYPELAHIIRKIVDQPIRVLIDTNYYVNHTGLNADFLSDGSQVIAQQSVKQALQSYHPDKASISPPSFTYDKEQDLHFGLVEVRLLHFGPARTSGDTIVYFPELKAVALGDLYTADPKPDESAGGSLAGWSTTLGEVLKLDFNVAIPGNGPTVTKSDVEQLKSRIDAALAHQSASSR